MLTFSLNKSGKLIYRNFEQNDCTFENCPVGKTEKIFCKKYNEERRRGIIQKDEYKLYLCSNEEVNSSRLFNSKAEIILEFAPYIFVIKEDYEKENKFNIDRLSHNLKKYSAHCIQASENILDPYSGTSGTKLQIDFIRNKIKNSIDLVSKSLLIIIKNNKLIQSELSVYDRLSKNQLNRNTDKNHHSVHKIIRAILSAFWNSFTENNIHVEMSECRKDIFVDYETFTVSIVHIIDNCTKYICPYSTLYISFLELNSSQIKISFKMKSLRINDNEVDKIFNQGYSGDLSREIELNGTGTGLYIVKTFIELNNGSIEIVINRDNSVVFNNVCYDDNNFEIIVPTQ